MASASDADLQELLRQPRESLDIELKQWLDLDDPNQRANVAKEIIALANHGGGYLVIGFSEDATGQFSVSAERPLNLSAWAQDSVQGIVQRYVEPPFQCSVHHVEHPDGFGAFPVIVVPGEHRVPIRARAGSPDGRKLVASRIYVRRPGPCSEEPQSAVDWDHLLERCIRGRRDELLDAMRNLLAGQVPAAEATTPSRKDELLTFERSAEARWTSLTDPLPPGNSARLPHGRYDAAFALDADFQTLPLGEFRDLLMRSLVNHSGWPPFVVINRNPYRPHPIDGCIEAWHGPDIDGTVDKPAHCDFWRISPRGLFYTRRGFQEDGGYRDIEPGATFDITSAPRRTGEAILEAVYVAEALGIETGSLIGRLSWTKLAGRKLVSLGNPNRSLSTHYVAHQGSYDAEFSVPLASVRDFLPDIVFEIVKPLYELFDFFDLSKRIVEQELADLRSRRFSR